MWVKKVNVVGDNILDKTYIAENFQVLYGTVLL